MGGHLSFIINLGKGSQPEAKETLSYIRKQCSWWSSPEHASSCLQPGPGITLSFWGKLGWRVLFFFLKSDNRCSCDSPQLEIPKWHRLCTAVFSLPWNLLWPWVLPCVGGVANMCVEEAICAYWESFLQFSEETQTWAISDLMRVEHKAYIPQMWLKLYQK